MIESVYYVIKQPQSVPMYDRITNSYQVLIDDEMVSVPKDLFDKMFETIDEQQARQEKDMLFSDINSVLNDESRQREFIDNMKDIIRDSARLVPKEMMIDFLKKQLANMGCTDADEAAKILEKVYVEIEEES